MYTEEFKSQNFFLNVFSNVEGDFIYYHKYQYGTVSFSERLFESMNQRFYYLRHSKSNDKVIFSTKSFKENDDSFLYYRKYKNDEHVIWSTKEFREAKSNFTYFRKYRGDERVLFSMKESFENNDKILYFRSKNGYGREICSIKNGRFRNQFRQEVTIGEFYKLFVSGFWNPLIKHTVYPSIKFISSELDRY